MPIPELVRTLRFGASRCCVRSAWAPRRPARACRIRLPATFARAIALLTTTYYEPVDPQALLAAAADALADAAQKHGVTIAPPHCASKATATRRSPELDAAIVGAAHAAHGLAERLCVRGDRCDGEGRRTTGTRSSSRRMSSRQFNEALDPARIGGIGVMIEPDPSTGCVRLIYVCPGDARRSRGPARRRSRSWRSTVRSTKGLDAWTRSARCCAARPAPSCRVTLARDERHAAVVSITREDVQPPTVVFKMLPGNIGYVWVMAFGEATPKEFDTAIARLNAQGAKALDSRPAQRRRRLRRTRRSISARASSPTRRCSPSKSADSTTTTIDADDNPSITLPVSVLVNQYTASASEITAGALQDDGIGMLVGAKTFGKGVMQTLTPLPDGAAIKITTAHYLTPNHRDINLRGIDPDVRVDENRRRPVRRRRHATRSCARRSAAQKKIAEAKLELAAVTASSALGDAGAPAHDVPLRPNATSSIRRRIRKMPKPRPRSSGSIAPAVSGAKKPAPLSRTSIDELVAVETAIDRAKRAAPVPRPCSTALLSASPAARRMSAISLSEKPQALANPATP